MRIASLIDEKIHSVEEYEDKLDDLNLRDVPLPPEILLHVRTEGGQTVVGVHYLWKEINFLKSYRLFINF